MYMIHWSLVVLKSDICYIDIAFSCEKTWWCKRQSKAGLGVICMNFSLLIAPDGQSWEEKDVAAWKNLNQLQDCCSHFSDFISHPGSHGVLASGKKIKRKRQKDKKTKRQKDKKNKKTKRQKEKDKKQKPEHGRLCWPSQKMSHLLVWIFHYSEETDCIQLIKLLRMVKSTNL